MERTWREDLRSKQGEKASVEMVIGRENQIPGGTKKHHTEGRAVA